MATNFKYLLTLITLISSSYCELTVNCPKERCASSGKCVDNLSLCPVAMTCPNRFFKTNAFTCTKDETNTVRFDCADNQYVCWDGSCAVDHEECPTMHTCPPSNGVRCSDNSCVKSIDDCPKYVSCPSFIPIRCPNGDCRRNLKDCPNIVRCPKEFSFLCNDGSCKMISEECEESSKQTQCSDQSLTRCSDGSCTNSKFLCPTPKTCPKNHVLCWDGSCAKSMNSCKSPDVGISNSCKGTNLVRCEVDGSCVENILNCPTPMICPIERPVKCWDLSCKENINKCPPYEDCPEGTISCSDGSCTPTVCGTQITCSQEAPFKCYDNTCRSNPVDCPSLPDENHTTQIQCWDGSVNDERYQCVAPEACPRDQSVKCPDNICRKSVEECRSISECPSGFSRCTDGSCMRKGGNARLNCNTCNSLDSQLTCPNGLCTNSLSTCDLKNGCPFYAPHKQNDGRCVADSAENEKDKTVECGENLKPCPDGSCLPLKNICPLQNGCPIHLPDKCADETCVDLSKTKCPIPTCPPELPVKCGNGLCVVSKSSCQSVSIKDENFICTQNLVPCGDGGCVSARDECKPIFPCPNKMVKCNDGSCKNNAKLCPGINTCPKTTEGVSYFRCSDGSCAMNKESCLNLSGCPGNNPIKCTNSGLCVKEISECNSFEDGFPNSNGCDNENPLKCPSGKCVKDLTKCEESNNCPQGEILCQNSGTCAKRLRDCQRLGTECPEGFVRCPKDLLCKPSYDECLNGSSCPVSHPFRCIDGSCKRYPYVNTQDLLDNSYCEIGIQCPDYKPYLCADGSCVEKSSFCQSYLKCPETAPITCFDRTCVKTQEECDKPKKKCPPKNPILCNISGKCVDSIFDCLDDSCSASAPIKCANGLCEKSPRNCVVTPLSPDGVCKSDEHTCYDGSCRKSMSHCPIFQGCIDTKNPYKCPDGSCRLEKAECAAAPTCNEGLKLCEDGICRKDCPAFSGCSNEKPLMCPNGFCVNYPAECAGISNCQIDTPIRCIDGSCVESISKCKNAKREYSGTDLQIFINKDSEFISNLIIGESNDVIGRILVPSNSLIEKNTSTKEKYTSGIISVQSLPVSELRHLYSTFSETRLDKISAIFPFADPNNNLRLHHEYTLLSSVVKIDFVEKDKYEFSSSGIIVRLSYDFPSLHPSTSKSGNLIQSELDINSDVGFARLIDDEWHCILLEDKEHVAPTTRSEYILRISEPGVYAVIMCPAVINQSLPDVSNFILDYFLIILIVSISIAAVVCIGIYIFIRIYRYRGKYQQSKEVAKNFEVKMMEMKSLGTSHLGQTVGDNLDNIIYTTNPSFKLKQDENNKPNPKLDSLHEAVNKKYKLLEKNNESLKRKYDNLNDELARLNEYKNQLENNQEDGIKIRVKDDDSEYS